MSEIIKNESYKLLKYLEMKRQKEILKTKAQESNARGAETGKCAARRRAKKCAGAPRGRPTVTNDLRMCLPC